jgi:hypothetical protein
MLLTEVSMGVKAADYEDFLSSDFVILSLTAAGCMGSRSTTMERTWRKGHSIFSRNRNPRNRGEHMNVRRWIRTWQTKFNSLGIELMVADVAQSSVVVNVPERTIILTPSLKVSTAEKVLRRLYRWWECQTGRCESQSYSLVSC